MVIQCFAFISRWIQNSTTVSLKGTETTFRSSVGPAVWLLRFVALDTSPNKPHQPGEHNQDPFWTEPKRMGVKSPEGFLVSLFATSYISAALYSWEILQSHRADLLWATVGIQSHFSNDSPKNTSLSTKTWCFITCTEVKKVELRTVFPLNWK